MESGTSGTKIANDKLSPPEVFLEKGVTNLQENTHAEVWFQ